MGVQHDPVLLFFVDARFELCGRDFKHHRRRVSSMEGINSLKGRNHSEHIDNRCWINILLAWNYGLHLTLLRSTLPVRTMYISSALVPIWACLSEAF